MWLRELFSYKWIFLSAEFSAYPRGSVFNLMGYDGDGKITFTGEVLPLVPSENRCELVRVPKNVKHYELQGKDREKVTIFGIRRAGIFVRRTLMWYRVIYTILVVPEIDCRVKGLKFFLGFYDLPKAFSIATDLRFPYEPLKYSDWVTLFDQLNADDLLNIQRLIGKFSGNPYFHVIVDARDNFRKSIRQTLTSLKVQVYGKFDVTVLDGDSEEFDESDDSWRFNVFNVKRSELLQWLDRFNESCKKSGSRNWVLRLRSGDVLPPNALFEYAELANKRRDERILYADHDFIDEEQQRFSPNFKPDWSLSHFLAQNYIGDAVVVRCDAMALVGGLDESACQYGLFDKILLLVGLHDEKPIHVSSVLLHKKEDDSKANASREVLAVQGYLRRREILGGVSMTLSGCREIRYQLPACLPLVSIIIPTRDAVELLRRCVDSVLEKTRYANYEILVVDNQSRDPGAVTYLKSISQRTAVRVLTFDCPFNFSAINNFAAREARGEFLCLLNNDTEVITPDWLNKMVGQALQDRVGVVGAKLLYPDGSVQHAGDVVGPGGCANHLHNGIAGDDPGYCNRAVVVQDLSAVTAACLLTKRDLYIRLGGLDERYLKIAYNDVDYCLRVREAGFRVVWTPHARLYHHESVSRGTNDTWRKELRSEFESIVMRRRWRHIMRSDPFYNPNLNYRQPDFSPSRIPRIRKSWQQSGLIDGH